MWQTKPNEVHAVGAAFRLWRTFGFTRPEEFALEDVAFARGVLVTDGILDSADARLVRSGERGIIRVSDKIPEVGRRRFAIAHELGHWEMHSKVTQFAVCTDDDMVANYKASAPEIEANIFAAELLMPTKLFGAEIESAVPSFSLISHLAERFQTSLTAAVLRFIDLSPEACAIVFAENNRIKWWRASKSFSHWLRAGSSLPTCSLASRYFTGKPEPREPQESLLDEWVSSSEDLHSETIVEQAFVFDRYNRTASLLWMQ